MRLYSTNGTGTVHHPDHGTFEADADSGAFDLPEDLGRMLHHLHIGGLKMWENDAERAARIAAIETERRKDPAALLDAVERLAARIEQPVGDLATGRPGVRIESGDPAGPVGSGRPMDTTPIEHVQTATVPTAPPEDELPAPSMASNRAAIDAYGEAHGIDTTGAATKRAALALLDL